MMFDEPACGGTRKQILDAKGDLACHRGWVAAAARSHVTMDVENPQPTANPTRPFGGIATALVIGNTLWLGSYQMDRAAWRELPGIKPGIKPGLK
jgi:hypothetical protein